MLDEDRIDILDTLIRTTIDEINLLPTDALLVMRSWGTGRSDATCESHRSWVPVLSRRGPRWVLTS